MEEPFLNIDSQPSGCAWYKIPMKAIVLVTTGATLFGILLGILHTTQTELHDVHSMIDEQQIMLQDIHDLVNATHVSNAIAKQQFDAFYKLAKLICMLNPDYKQYCSLI